MTWSLFLSLGLISSTVYLSASIAVFSVDLGTDWMKVAIVKPGMPLEVALNRESSRKTPVAVAFREGERSIGDNAWQVALRYPSKAFLSFTILLGKRFESKAVELYQKRYPHHTLVKDERRGTVLLKAEDGELYSPEELTAMLLAYARTFAQEFADHPLQNVVVTVPSFFLQPERESLLTAIQLAGLIPLEIINDNTAVALQYGITKWQDITVNELNYMVFDIGSSSTAATVVSYKMQSEKEKVPEVTIKGYGYNRHVGGANLDFVLRDHFADAFLRMKKLDSSMKTNSKSMMKLLVEGRRVKTVLSANTDVEARVESLFQDLDFKLPFTRKELEELCKGIFESIAAVVDGALASANMTADNLTAVVLMGGGSRVPKAQEALMRRAQKSELAKNLNTDEAAALGAVYRAADLAQGFKVKPFSVKDCLFYPIEITFERSSVDENGHITFRNVTRSLYQYRNTFPQKKMMTFNKITSDFKFWVSLPDNMEATEFGSDNSILHVQVSGVEDAFADHKLGTPKGIQAHFVVDSNGIFNVTRIEAVFEEEKAQDSIINTLSNSFSSLFGAGVDKDAAKEDTGKPLGDAEKDSEKTTGGSDTEVNPGQPDGTQPGSEPNSDSRDAGNEGAKPPGSNPAESADTSTVPKDSNNTSYVRKMVTVKVPLQFTKTILHVQPMNGDEISQSLKRLKELQVRDDKKMEDEKARNDIESYLLDMMEKVESSAYATVTTEKEREKIMDALVDGQGWFEENGRTAEAEECRTKLAEIKSTHKHVDKRITEMHIRDKAFVSITDTINAALMFVEKSKTIPDLNETIADVDLKLIDELATNVSVWVKEKWALQNMTSVTSKPVVTSDEIIQREDKIRRELMYIVNKLKYATPKPKGDDKKKTASKSSKGDATPDDAKSEERTDEQIPGELPPSGSEQTPASPDTSDNVKVEL